jgi:hypothetical protein
MHLHSQDFNRLTTYNSAVFKITSQLKLCGEKVTDEDMLKMTFFTFHASNVLLQRQYREKRFKKYSDLISCLLVAEQNNELLMKNHKIRLTSTVAKHDHYGQTHGCGFGRRQIHDFSLKVHYFARPQEGKKSNRNIS